MGSYFHRLVTCFFALFAQGVVYIVGHVLLLYFVEHGFVCSMYCWPLRVQGVESNGSGAKDALVAIPGCFMYRSIHRSVEDKNWFQS